MSDTGDETPRKSSKSLRKSSKKKPINDNDDQLDEPNWTFPQEILDETYDIKPLFKQVQKEFALSILRNQIQ